MGDYEIMVGVIVQMIDIRISLFILYQCRKKLNVSIYDSVLAILLTIDIRA